MNMNSRPLKDDGTVVTIEDEEKVCQWIADFLKTSDVAVIQAYYLYFAISTGMWNDDMLNRDIKNMSPGAFVQKHSLGMFSKHIWHEVYDKEFFDDRFVGRYEALHQSSSSTSS